jgi:hypothetical protein
MPQGSAHIKCLRLTELEKVCHVLASLAPEPGRPIHALYIRVDSEAHRDFCGYNCFGELNSLVEANLGMTSEFYRMTKLGTRTATMTGETVYSVTVITFLNR